MKRRTAQDRRPLLATALVWLVGWVAFSVRLDAQPDFQLFLYLFEAMAWLMAAVVAGWLVSGASMAKPWKRAAWWAVVAAFLLFPLGAVALASAEEICGLYRNWTGPPRALSAQYFFREFTGLRLDQGFVDGGRNILWAVGLGLISMPFWGAILFGVSLLTSSRDAASARSARERN